VGSFFDVRENLASGVPAGEPPLSVTDLTGQIKLALKRAFGRTLVVRGEVSNFRGVNQSGHLYFRLKDQGAVIDAVMFRNSAAGLSFDLAEGLEVLATGRLDLYEQGGRYNLVVTQLAKVGTGALEVAFRKLKEKLEAEGLFAAERKRPIPPYPRAIAVMTSRTGAALADMLKVLSRTPWLRVIVVPIPVQGEQAAPAIVRALKGVNGNRGRLGNVDLILLGRGGGSFEDLFEFSREEVARAIAESEIPVITGIGHETDTSIADFVADHRAHTPTEAATFAVRNWIRSEATLETARTMLYRDVGRSLEHARQRLMVARRAVFFARPEEIAGNRQRRVDDVSQQLREELLAQVRARQKRVAALLERLARHDPRRVLVLRRETLVKFEARLTHAMSRRLQSAGQRVAAAATRLERRHPAQRVMLLRQRLTTTASRLPPAMQARLADLARRLAHVETQLRLLGPESALARGYSLTLAAESGELVRTVRDAPPGTVLETRLADGSVRSRVD
jgi:exodeoxyribonuclease VII large subunit